MGNRLNWNQRQGPGDFDDTAPTKPTYEFDLRRNTIPGGQSWPERLQGERFGPRFVERAWKAGLIVIAEIPSLPFAVTATEVKWSSGILVVNTAEGWRTPDRVYTRKTMAGIDSTGIVRGDK